MIENLELLPCPFCGERAELHALDMDYATYGVECSCGAGLTVAGSPVDAISAWNRRAALLSAAPDMLEALKEARAWIAIEIENIGPCDHAVGLCVCGDRSMLTSIDAAIAKATGEPVELREAS